MPIGQVVAQFAVITENGQTLPVLIDQLGLVSIDGAIQFNLRREIEIRFGAIRGLRAMPAAPDERRYSIPHAPEGY